MLATDFRGVYASGIDKADKELASVRTLDFKSFTLGEMDVVFIAKDAAIVTYQVTTQGTEGGKDISGKPTPHQSGRRPGTIGASFFTLTPGRSSCRTRRSGSLPAVVLKAKPRE